MSPVFTSCPKCGDTNLQHDKESELYFCDTCGEWWSDADVLGVSGPDVPFCEEHQIPMILFDYLDESRYECPECKREDGEALGLM